MTTCATRVIHFRDSRPPHEVKLALERKLRVLFNTAMVHSCLCMQAKAVLVGAAYQFLLRFDAALQTCNCYSLTMDVSWPELTAEHSDYYRKTSASWFEFWTREFVANDPPLANEGSLQRYGQLCDDAFEAEKELDSVAAIQLAIVTAMKRGASFRSSHKEGGTIISWRSEHFVRTDYGDYPDEKLFEDESQFLMMLRQHCYWEVHQQSGEEQLSEVDIWRLILRRMDLTHPTRDP